MSGHNLTESQPGTEDMTNGSEAKWRGRRPVTACSGIALALWFIILKTHRNFSLSETGAAPG
jgi:hypothetical protein